MIAVTKRTVSVEGEVLIFLGPVVPYPKFFAVMTRR